MPEANDWLRGNLAITVHAGIVLILLPFVILALLLLGAVTTIGEFFSQNPSALQKEALPQVSGNKMNFHSEGKTNEAS